MAYVRSLLSIILIFVLFSEKGIPQNGQSYTADKTKTLQSAPKIPDYADSIWCFYPFSINIAPGIWFPASKLSTYYDPCFQLGLGFGIMFTSKVRLELGLTPHFLINKKKITVSVNDTLRETNTPSSASIGGGLNIAVYRNSTLCLELIPGLSWEPLSTEIKKPGTQEDDDSKVSISTVGYSLGLNTWINKFGRQNFGIKAAYGYAAYYTDSSLISDIGGSYISISLCYRWPAREAGFVKYYHY
jgi:hypothetical protein